MRTVPDPDRLPETRWAWLTAGVILAGPLLIVVFLLMQEQLVRGIAATGLRG